MMFKRLYIEFFGAEDALRKVLTHWKLLAPYFASKKTSVLSPEARSKLILSLRNHYQRVETALKKVHELIACWNAYNRISVFHEEEKFTNEVRARFADSLEPYGEEIKNQIAVVLFDFENPTFGPIPFNRLPYEYQKRLVQLLPPKDVTSFKSAGNTAFKTVKKHRRNFNFVNSLFVVHFNPEENEFRLKKTGNQAIDRMIISKFDFLKPKLAPFYVGNKLSIFLNNNEAYFKAMHTISGDFERIEIYGGGFSWKQAFKLIYKSPRVKYATVKLGSFQGNQFNQLFNNMILLLKTRDIELRIFQSYYLQSIAHLLDKLDSSLGFFVCEKGDKLIVSKFLSRMTYHMSQHVLNKSWVI